MKFDKLIELLKEMETTIEAEENQTLLEKLNREEMINTMQFLQRCAAQAGYYYNLQAPGSEFGTMKLQTAENDDLCADLRHHQPGEKEHHGRADDTV